MTHLQFYFLFFAHDRMGHSFSENYWTLALKIFQWQKWSNNFESFLTHISTEGLLLDTHSRWKTVILMFLLEADTFAKFYIHWELPKTQKKKKIPSKNLTERYKYSYSTGLSFQKFSNFWCAIKYKTCKILWKVIKFMYQHQLLWLYA